MALSLDVMLPSNGNAFTEPAIEPNHSYYSRGVRERFRIDGLKPLPIEPKPESYADICYDVDEYKFRARAEARLEAGGLRNFVPDGWPAAVSGPIVWTSTDHSDESEYVYQLTDNDKEEIREAL